MDLQDAAMGLVMSAATGSGWTTGSGMEGPPTAGGMDRPEVSTLPWSLFTNYEAPIRQKSPFPRIIRLRYSDTSDTRRYTYPWRIRFSRFKKN
jgi:hypothetical protein